MDDHLDRVGVASQRLVDRVVDELVDHVVQPVDIGVADVHARAAADRLEALEDLDVRAGVVGRRSEIVVLDGVRLVFGFV